MNSLTQIENLDHKIDIIDHVNQDHGEELLAIAQLNYQEAISAKLTDIFKEALQLQVTKKDKQQVSCTIPFSIEGELEDKILYLAYAAVIKQGRDFSGNASRFFEVVGKEQITANFIRITIKSQSSLPVYYPGYAFACLLKVLKKSATAVESRSSKKHWFKNRFDRVFIWLLKHLSIQNRKKLLLNANKGVRLYTLRKSWQSEQGTEFCNLGHIDIFTHDQTAGSQWAKQLEIGDIIQTRSETADKHLHLTEGQCLLIADETAYPALAGILEHWNNPMPPHIILLSAKETDQFYFDATMLPAGSHLQRIVCSAQQQGNKALELIEDIPNIDNVWAALESDSAKKIRHYLRNQRKLKGKNNHTKAYWKLNK